MTKRLPIERVTKKPLIDRLREGQEMCAKIGLEDWSIYKEAADELTILRRVLSIIATSFPTKLIGGKTGDEVKRVIAQVLGGEPVTDE